jgi:hypothetical protein
VAYLNQHALPKSYGRCAEFTRRAIEAGGLKLARHLYAKDYGASLTAVEFRSVGQLAAGFKAGDVVVIQPIPKHPEGHMAMFNGTIWISDFKQLHGLYPGPTYRALKPLYAVYRYGAAN